MFELVCILIPMLLAAVGLVLPAVLDLVMRDEDVKPYWGLPFLVLLPFLVINLAIPFLMDPGMDRVIVPMFGWGLLHWGAAGLFLALSMGLAFSRGLRPGGETLRRRRTSLLIVVFMLVLMVVPWLPGMISLLWVVPPAWAGLFFALALNRRGPQRLERGKTGAAAFLFAAALSFLIGAAHIHRAMDLIRDPLEIPWFAWLGSVGALAALAGGLRWLNGPPSPGPLLAVALSALSLGFPLVWQLAFDPVPKGIETPAWVDFAGNAGPATRTFNNFHCLPVTAADGTTSEHGPDCPYSYPEAVLIDARTTLDRVPIQDTNNAFLVDDGRRHTWSWGRYDPPVLIYDATTRTPPLANGAYDAVISVQSLDAALSERIREKAGFGRPITVYRSARWTMQDFISMCASLSTEPLCTLAPPE